MKQTQVDKIYKALKAGRVLTALDIFRISGSLSATRRITDIVRIGPKAAHPHAGRIVIARGWKVVKGRKYRSYRMA